MPVLTEVERVSRAAISRVLDVDATVFDIAIELQPAWDDVIRQGT
jgi:hypothetical protein